MAALWNRLWGHSAGVKRSAPTDEILDHCDNSDDQISFVSSPGDRQPLVEGIPDQIQNQRLRPLKYVEIPKPSQEDQAMLKNEQALKSADGTTTHRNLKTNARPLTSHVYNQNRRIDEFFENKEYSSTGLAIRDSRHARTSKSLEDDRPTKRLRRAGSRRSYVSQVLTGDSDDSADELLDSARAIRIPKPARKDSISPEASDYELEETEGDEDDYGSSPESNGWGSDIETTNDDDFSDDVLPVKPTMAPASKADVLKRGKATPWTPANKKNKRMDNLLTRGKGVKGLDPSLPPLSEIDDIFEDITKRALSFGFDKALKHLGACPLRVATMCSGTESPILSLRMIQKALKSLSLDQFQIDHLFSAEIVPYKQAYIERNFNPPIIFRDITELTEAVKMDHHYATTAYGAKVRIPTSIDVLIAGTSCVDFSRLNSYQKGLSDGGESDKTWHAVLNYCKAFKPKIVLLENVKTAHWDQMLCDYENIGYEVAGVHVDTKDFYIPQTRQRGYMVCFDKCHSKPAEANSAPSPTKWQHLMAKFRRYASSPVSSFLLTNDQVIARELARADELRRDYDWSKCEITQMQYRQNQKLGNARPFTNWQESGAILVPDNGSKSWYSMQVERVLDTIDAAILRKALPKNGGYDARYKTRIWNLSQNIYRDEDKQNFGMIGCITPSGQYFVSDVGRALTSEETLKLQGLPLDMISFTTETAPELQDLAGNAMSSSVVGSAILSALIAGYTTIDVGDKSLDSQSALRRPEAQMISGPMVTTNHSIVGQTIATCTILKHARKALRRCYCEQNTGIARKPIQKCQDCGHTTCTSCGGNPAHNYSQRSYLSDDRVNPANFEAKLKSKLPLRVKLDVRTEIETLNSSTGKSNKALQAYFDLVKKTTDTEFFLSHFRRTHCLTVTYQSANGRLELVIVDDNVEWRLFVASPKDLPCNDWLRQVLTQPAAKCAAGDTLFDGVWEFRVPEVSTSQVQIVGHGKQMPSWWARNEMPEFVNHTQWEFLTISANNTSMHTNWQEIEGTYQYLPKCGTACDSLYKKVGRGTASDVFLFLDPWRTESPEKDKFVFSRNKALLEYDEVRLTLASLDTNWRPWDQKPWKLGAGKKIIKDSQATEKMEVTMIEDCRWIQSSVAVLCPLSSNMDISIARDLASFVTRREPASCGASTMLISCTVGQIAHQGKPRTTVDLGDSDFFSQNAWVFEAMRRQLSDSWHHLSLENIAQTCDSCAPARPSINWKMSHDGDIMPFEDPSGAAAYERAIKSRPDPVVVSKNPTSISIGVNLISLAHRALRRLPTTGNDPELDWRLSTDDVANFPFNFQPFKLKNSNDIVPYTQDVLTVEMFPKQRLALAWMRQQEIGEGQTIALEASEEVALPKLRWTVEMRAKTSTNVRGGVCADHPGFGKTITSLALIESQFRDMDAATIRDQLQSRSAQLGKGLLATAATLIVCPQVLLDQWISEIQDKLGYKTGCIAIRNVTDLGKHSIQAFQNAKIILVNRTALGSDAYAERVAAFAGVPGPITNKSRTFGAWLEYATTQIPEHLSILQESGQARLRQHVKKMYEDRIKSDEFKVAVPSRRLRGKDYAAADQRKKQKTSKGSTMKPALGTLDTSTIGTPLFEMFYFNRLIIDEFHQYLPREYAAIVALKADKRWGLSATPALSDFYDVAQMAGLLGVTLPIGSDARGIMKIKNVRELRKEMTDFERFDSMRTVPSNALHSRIHAQHQKFLDIFVRRNIMDFEGMEYDDHLVPVQLDLDHQALYTELSQHLNSMDMRIKKGTKSKNTIREERLTNILDDSLSAEEALSKTATFDLEGTGATSQQAGLARLVSTRMDEVKFILEKLCEAMVDARAKEHDALSSWVESRLKGRTIGDQNTIEALEEIADAKVMKGNTITKKPKTKKTNGSSSDSDETAINTKEGKNALTSVVNTLAQRLLVANRSVRFTRNIQLVQGSANDRATLPSNCDRSQCNSKLGIAKIGISALCGHMICVGCFEQMGNNHTSKCPANGCLASMHNYHLLWSAKMGDLKDHEHTKFGAKIDSVTKLLQNIRSKGDQAIVFVQFQRQLDYIKTALKHCGILAIVVDESTRASAKIEEFRKSAQESSSQKKTAIVLNASDETAAGSNLQNANHIIFLSPLLRDTQYGYESTMAQAIGRVRRHGQKKHIHVYRIVALDTIDVDILEHRERRRDALCEQDMESVPPVVDLETDGINEKTPVERTQLVCENDRFSLRPKSWLVSSGQAHEGGPEKAQGKHRVYGWEDFSSLVKFSRAYTEDDE